MLYYSNYIKNIFILFRFFCFSNASVKYNQIKACKHDVHFFFFHIKQSVMMSKTSLVRPFVNHSCTLLKVS